MRPCGNTGSAGQATDENVIQRMRFACCITKATDTHSEYVILLFHSNNGDANVPHCYVTRTLPAFRDVCVLALACCSSVLVLRFGRSYCSASFDTTGRTQTGCVREQGGAEKYFGTFLRKIRNEEHHAYSTP